MIIQKNKVAEQDFSIAKIPPHLKHLLNSPTQPWLNSFNYCTGFDTLNPAERVYVKMSNDAVEFALFYRIKVRFGVLKTIEIEGFPEATDVQVEALLRLHSAHLVVVNRLEIAVKPDEEWVINGSYKHHKSYMTIVPFPTSKDEYLSLMGKNKRKQLPQYLRKLYRHFDDAIDFCYQTKEEIKLEDVIQLEVLNKKRRENQGKGVDSLREIEERQRNLMPLINASGLIVTVRHKGEILGGTLNFIHGNTAYMLVTGHDDANDNLRIGTLGIWKTMEYLIDSGVVSLNFLWGRKTYKTQFLGVEYPWTVHIVSSKKWLPKLWKYYLTVHEFYLRGKRFLQTRLGLH